MKSICIFVFLCSVNVLMAQITLTSKDFPLNNDSFQLLRWNVPKPTSYINQTWDYSQITALPTPSVVVFEKETIEDFLNAGIDVYRSGTKNFNSNFLYYVDVEYDLNENSFSEKGIYIPEQKYVLDALTGNNKDSLNMPLQGYIFNETVDHLRFPLTYKKSWSSKSRRVTSFELTVNAFGLKKAPAFHIWNVVRKDSIMGHGTMKIITPNGPSKSYDVLVDRIETYAQDSFLLNGQAAPPALLTAFGVSQGQKTNIANRINFYRKDLFYYFASFYFGPNSFNAQPTDFFVCTYDAEATTSYGDILTNKSIAIFPTVLSENENLNVQINEESNNAYHFRILDSSGKMSQTGNLNSNRLESIEILLSKGINFISIFDKEDKLITSEKIIVK